MSISKTSKAQKQHNLFVTFFIAELRANEDLLDAMVHFFIEKHKWLLQGYNGADDGSGLFKRDKNNKIAPNRKLKKYEMDALKAVLYKKNKYWKMYIGLKESLK